METAHRRRSSGESNLSTGKYRFCVALVVCSLLAGCVSRYQFESAGGHSAVLAMTRGAGHLGAKSLQEFEAYRDAACSPERGTGRMAALSTYMSQRKEALVDTGQRMYVLAKTSLYGTAPSREYNVAFYITTDSCSNLVSFVPQPQHTYEIVQEASGSSCSVRLVDSATSEEPPDLVVEDARLCRFGSEKG